MKRPSFPENHAGAGGPSRPAAQPSCPDAESLAAYADGKLSSSQSRIVERHLTECDICFEALSGTLGVERARDKRQALRRRLLAVAGSSTGIAAAVWLAVILPGRSMSSPMGRPELAELVAAVGTTRVIEPRMTGGFNYAPVRAPVRSGESVLDASSPDVRIAVARIEQKFESSRRPEDIAALGVAYLSVANTDRAVAALEESTDLPTPDPNGLSDLAAAYLVKGTEQKQSQDVAKALSAAERAVNLTPQLVEASFNRALALEQLFLTQQARQAWEAYLKLDGHSGWADEARRHVEALDRAVQNIASGAAREFVDQAARGTDGHVLDDAVRRFPQIARDWAEAELLSAWPQAALAGREAQAAASLSASRRVAVALARATGDRLLQDAVSAVDRARGPNVTALAAAHQTFGEAMVRYEDDARAEAMRLFERAFKPLEEAGSPFALWTQLQFAIGAYFNSDLPGASAVLRPIAPAAERADRCLRRDAR
jgi:tetratricopeptide (TPR) repeat protein